MTDIHCHDAGGMQGMLAAGSMLGLQSAAAADAPAAFAAQEPRTGSAQEGWQQQKQPPTFQQLLIVKWLEHASDAAAQKQWMGGLGDGNPLMVPVPDDDQLLLQATGQAPEYAIYTQMPTAEEMLKGLQEAGIRTAAAADGSSGGGSSSSSSSSSQQHASYWVLAPHGSGKGNNGILKRRQAKDNNNNFVTIVSGKEHGKLGHFGGIDSAAAPHVVVHGPGGLGYIRIQGTSLTVKVTGPVIGGGGSSSSSTATTTMTVMQARWLVVRDELPQHIEQLLLLQQQQQQLSKQQKKKKLPKWWLKKSAPKKWSGWVGSVALYEFWLGPSSLLPASGAAPQQQLATRLRCGPSLAETSRHIRGLDSDSKWLRAQLLVTCSGGYGASSMHVFELLLAVADHHNAAVFKSELPVASKERLSVDVLKVRDSYGRTLLHMLVSQVRLSVAQQVWAAGSAGAHAGAAGAAGAGAATAAAAAAATAAGSSSHSSSAAAGGSGALTEPVRLGLLQRLRELAQQQGSWDKVRRAVNGNGVPAWLTACHFCLPGVLDFFLQHPEFDLLEDMMVLTPGGRSFYHIICRQAVTLKSKGADTSQHTQALERTLAALADKVVDAFTATAASKRQRVGGGSSSSPSHWPLEGPSLTASGGEQQQQQQQAVPSAAAQMPPEEQQCLRKLVCHIQKRSYDVAMLRAAVWELLGFDIGS